MNKDVTEYMEVAIEEALKAKDKGDLPFGAVVVHDGTIIGKGHAQDNSHGDVTAHAEMEAIREACASLGRNHLYDCTIYTTCEPCNMCGSAIFQAKIPTVVFGLMREDLPWLMRPRKIRIGDLARDSSFDIEITRGVMKEEVLELFADIER
ncbi:MAG: nucleoside deaminase [Patescibacteria group bacterium]|jgi:tRNA(Arg) A34 adenosine deaminase TadA